MRLVSARRCRPAAWPRVTTPGAICPVRLTGLPGGPTSPGSLPIAWPLVQGRASGVVAMAERRRVDVGEGIAQERVDAVRLGAGLGPGHPLAGRAGRLCQAHLG